MSSARCAHLPSFLIVSFAWADMFCKEGERAGLSIARFAQVRPSPSSRTRSVLSLTPSTSHATPHLVRCCALVSMQSMLSPEQSRHRAHRTPNPRGRQPRNAHNTSADVKRSKHRRSTSCAFLAAPRRPLRVWTSACVGKGFRLDIGRSGFLFVRCYLLLF